MKRIRLVIAVACLVAVTAHAQGFRSLAALERHLDTTVDGWRFRITLSNLQPTINTEPTSCQHNCPYDAC